MPILESVHDTTFFQGFGSGLFWRGAMTGLISVVPHSMFSNITTNHSNILLALPSTVPIF